VVGRSRPGEHEVRWNQETDMTIETIPGSDLRYHLVSYDKNGKERDNDPDAPKGRLSEVVKRVLKEQPVTDVFFMSHGWKGDVPAAKEQYDKWTAAMLGCENDRNRMRELRPDFRPLIIGLHWPSLPWGDEELTPEAAFGGAESPIQDWIEDAADKLADTERARAALATIFASALDDMAPPELPAEVVEAYKVLAEEAGLVADGVGAAPGADIDLFDPEVIYEQAMEEESAFGGFPGVGGVLSVLRQLSFWKMKARARIFGESGGADLLRELQTIAAEASLQDAARGDIRFHLMGHSFGCIVVSATMAGAGGDAPLPKPVDSMYLVQGALSLWAYCNDIPADKGTPGYFKAIVGGGKVAGPIVTTQSEHDTAVGRLYPLGARIKGQVDMAPGKLPKYGGLGTFGARGPGIVVEDVGMLPLSADYAFAGGRVYNLDGSDVINGGEGVSGAHSDIACRLRSWSGERAREGHERRRAPRIQRHQRGNRRLSAAGDDAGRDLEDRPGRDAGRAVPEGAQVALRGVHHGKAGARGGAGPEGPELGGLGHRLRLRGRPRRSGP
jgi:hypothetical protein